MNRDQLLDKFRTKVTPVKIGDDTIYLKNLLVSDNNYFLYEDRQNQIKHLKSLGFDTDKLEKEELDKLINENPSPETLAKIVAMKLCDEHGNNLFDVRNKDDLAAINSLDQTLINAIAGFDDTKKN